MEKDMGRINALVYQLLAEGHWDEATRIVEENYSDAGAKQVLLSAIEEKRSQREAATSNPNMTTCKYCGKTISKTAKTCPHCGGRFKKPVYKRWWFIALAVVVVICILGNLGGDKGKQNAPSAPDKHQSDVANAPTPSVPDEAEKPNEYIPPEPVVYTGTGDDVVEITPPANDIWLLRVTGNSGAHHFAIKGYDENGEYVELFVNTTEPYSGVTFDPTLSTTTLEINAEGDWKVEVVSLALMDKVYGGETYTGTGDMIFLVYDYGKTADISGNADAHQFAVKCYGETSWDLLVNTTDPYNGTVMMRENPFFMVVTAESPWSITLSK